MAVPQKSLFHEKQGIIYYITNWRDRFHDGGKPTLVKLSPRHLKLYNKYNTRGRSQKSVYYCLMRDKGRLGAVRDTREMREMRQVRPTRETRVVANRKAITVEVDLDILTKDQLITTIANLSNEKMPYLVSLGLKDLRHLYQTMDRMRSDRR